MNTSLGQHDYDHDHCHDLDNQGQYLGANIDQEQNPDLEAPVNTTGTVWVDAADADVDSMAADTGDTMAAVDDTFNCDASGEPQSEARADNEGDECPQESWSDVVKKCSSKLVHARGCDTGNGARDFIIPGKNADNRNVRLRGVPSRRGWGGIDLAGPGLQHNSIVEPVFLAYNRIGIDGQRVSLMQIATAIVDALNDAQAVDAIQPMKFSR